MNETYQNRITDQICKIQNDRALIAFYDRLRYAPLGNYAQLHAKGEYQENGHKVQSASPFRIIPTVPETGISSPVSTWHRNRSSSS
jgi:hypothetical protein